MAVVSLGLLGTGSSKTAATTLAVTNTTGALIPAGTLIHITGCWDNIASVTAPTITSSTIGGATATANHATAIGSGITTTAGSGVWHQCFRALTTASIAIGAVICTLTSNQSAVVRAAHAVGWSGVQNALRGTVATGVSTTGAPTVQTAGTALVTGDLVVGSASFENSAQMTADADTLNGSWSAIVGTFTTGAGAATNVGTASQFKVITGTGAQSFDPTGGVADTIACVYSLVPLPEPTVTQASYRFYADGTETGSVALAAQDTAYTADVSAADMNLLLRTRLQSTNTGLLPATDDYQLQWEKNGSGTWTSVLPPGNLLVDTLPTGNGPETDMRTAVPRVSQSFIGNGQKLSRAGFLMHKTGTPDGTITAALYSHSGTYGVSSIPSGTLRNSTTTIASTSLSTSLTWVYFDFDETYTMVNGTPYCISVSTTNSVVSTVFASLDTTGAQHAGNQAAFTTFWSPSGSQDLVFEVYYKSNPVGVLPYDSPSLTEGTATTNRLGAGTGSFTAGKVSEDGLVDDLGWTSNNYTEVLYSITLKRADLASGDTVRFRILRNGATTGLTYTQTPTVPIINTAVTAAGRPKVWTGSQWVQKPLKVWNGSTWVEKPLKVWTGTQWKVLT